MLIPVYPRKYPFCGGIKINHRHRMAFKQLKSRCVIFCRQVKIIRIIVQSYRRICNVSIIFLYKSIRSFLGPNKLPFPRFDLQEQHGRHFEVMSSAISQIGKTFSGYSWLNSLEEKIVVTLLHSVESLFRCLN